MENSIITFYTVTLTIGEHESTQQYASTAPTVINAKAEVHERAKTDNPWAEKIKVTQN